MDRKVMAKSSHHGTVATNPTRNHEVTGSIPGLYQWVKDLGLLWLWCRPATVALIGPLAWEPPYAMSVALKSKKQKAKNKKQKKKKERKKRKVMARATCVCVVCCRVQGSLHA